MLSSRMFCSPGVLLHYGRNTAVIVQVSARRLFSTSTQTKSPKDPSSRSTRIIQTLNPLKFSTAHQQLFDISGLPRPSFSVAHTDPNTDAKFPSFRINYHFNQSEAKKDFDPFPSGTVGTLYYRAPAPGEPELCGGVRFRIMRAAGADSEGSWSLGRAFEEGVDLRVQSPKQKEKQTKKQTKKRTQIQNQAQDLHATATATAREDPPWHIPLCNLATRQTWAALLWVLTSPHADALVDPALVADLKKLDITTHAHVNYHYALGQPFELHKGQRKISRMLIRRDMVHRLTWQVPGWGGGPLRVRLELQDSPSLGPGLVIRVLEVLSPSPSPTNPSPSPSPANPSNSNSNSNSKSKPKPKSNTTSNALTSNEPTPPPTAGSLLARYTKPLERQRLGGAETAPLFYALRTRKDGEDVGRFVGVEVR